MKIMLNLKNENDTLLLAQNIESEKFPNMVICLIGDLGSGKTFFTKAFAQSMEINENITSPTFNIIKEYITGEMPLYHMDVYRLDGDTTSINIEDYYNMGGVTIIEWADTIEDILPDERLEIRLQLVDEDKRVAIINAYGEKYENILGTLS